ncbi:MAG: TetR family transcriptional regulator [Arthrobacter sp.]|jgi:AcrR family transcriptional regulator|nr:TetR family transcriptional regulator [Arthrobacter sp.]
MSVPRTLPQASIPGPLGRNSERGRLLDAAADHLAEHGFERLPAAALARAAGVAEERVRQHFPTEEAMFASALTLVDARNISAYFAGAQGRGWAGLEAWAPLLDAVVHQPGALQLYSTMRAQAGDSEHPAHGWVSTHRDLCTEVLQHAMLTGIEAGEMAPSMPVDLIAYQMIAMTEGVQLHWLSSGGRAQQGEPLRAFVEDLRYRYGLPAREGAAEG